MIAFKKLKLVKAIITQLGVYPYFKKYYNLVPIDLSKQQALDADSKAIQQIGFTGNLQWDGNTTISFIIKKAKETVFRLFKRYRSLLSDTQFSRIRKAFANGSSVNIIFSSTQLSKMVQLGGFVIQYIPVLLMFYWMQLKRGQM